MCIHCWGPPRGPWNCQTSQAPHPALIHKSQWHQGATLSSHLLLLLPMSNDDDACSMGHASTAGDTQVVPRTSQLLHELCLPHDLVCPCLQPPVDQPPFKAGPIPHTGSPASIQAAGAPSCVTGWACCCIHTHVWHWGTTCPFHLLIMSGNDNARSLEHATTTGDTQEVPRDSQVPHKPHLPFHCLSMCCLHKLQSPHQAGRHHRVAAKPHCCCCAPGAQIDTHVHMHMVCTREHQGCSQPWVLVQKGEKHYPNDNHNKPVVLAKPEQLLVFTILNTRTNVLALCQHICHDAIAWHHAYQI